jgi:dTDP-4-dehydrorhamnose 3,5-epimerase
MKFIKTKFNKAWLIEPKVNRDNRGFFLESYSVKQFQDNGIYQEFIQDNHSLSIEKDVIRGLHFQTPLKEQSKLIRVIRGSVIDIIVDLRKNESTYGKWQSFNLSCNNFLMLFIPMGFAHGFCTLEPNTEVVYKVDNIYSQLNESGIIWNDSTLDIQWPINNPILSEKDKKLQNFKDFISPF